MDAETPHKNPINMKTTGTILSTSIPIKVAASGFSAIALKALPTFVRINKYERAATIRIEKIKLINWGIEMMKPATLQSKFVKGVENPRVSEPCAINIKYSKINKKPRDDTKGIACSVASPCFILKYL